MFWLSNKKYGGFFLSDYKLLNSVLVLLNGAFVSYIFGAGNMVPGCSLSYVV